MQQHPAAECSRREEHGGAAFARAVEKLGVARVDDRDPGFPRFSCTNTAPTMSSRGAFRVNVPVRGADVQQHEVRVLERGREFGGRNEHGRPRVRLLRVRVTVISL